MLLKKFSFVDDVHLADERLVLDQVILEGHRVDIVVIGEILLAFLCLFALLACIALVFPHYQFILLFLILGVLFLYFLTHYFILHDQARISDLFIEALSHHCQ